MTFLVRERVAGTSNSAALSRMTLATSRDPVTLVKKERTVSLCIGSR